MKYLHTLIICLFTLIINAQSISWSTLTDMPEQVSNNAVTAAMVDGTPFVFSFAGIDDSKNWFGIHLKGFRYNTATEIWDSIPPLPDPNGGKIAASANTVKNKVYIIGGYHVASDYSETSSSKVHIYNPETNDYEADGVDIPVPIDDQVQAVWRDSLIYVISGWSNTGNVRNVQIYNPSTDTWDTATPIPNSSTWKVFGGAGVIIGDTIFYAGGAKSIGNFGPTVHFRKGAINPDNPFEITWIGEDNPAAKGYRMAAAAIDGQPFWIGGSNDTYNFDGVAYNGSGGVEPLGRILGYSPNDGQITTYNDVISPIMDLRGIAQISDREFILAGGMTGNQTVSKQTQLITIDYLQGASTYGNNPLATIIHPNPVSDWLQVEVEGNYDVHIFNQLGQELLILTAHSGAIDVNSLPANTYYAIFSRAGILIAKERFVVLR